MSRVTLDEIVASIDAFADERIIFAHYRWTAESIATVSDVARDGLEFFCRVSDAKEKLRHYIGDPPRMRVARVVAFADARRAERAHAERAKRVFSYEANPVGYFEQAELPRGPGRYPYMPYRGIGHLRMRETIERDGSARCQLPNGVRFRVVATPGQYVLQIDDLET